MRKVLYILGHFTDEDVSWMMEVRRDMSLAKGRVLIEQGAVIDRLYFVTSGTLDVTVPDFGSVAKLHTGEILGEMSFLDAATPEVTVQATEDATLFAIEFEDIRERFIEEPRFETRLYKAIAQFLSLRLRLNGRRMTQKSLSPDEPELLDELDEATLKQIQIAGERFSRLLQGNQAE